MPFQPATTLADIRRNCSPAPLADGGLAAFFVETDDARSGTVHLRAQLEAILSDPSTTRRILVYGHRGCGKSTELNKLKEKLRHERFVVSLSIQKLLPPFGIKAEDILLAMATAVFDAAEKAQPPLAINESLLKEVERFFGEVTVKETVESVARIKGGAGAGVKGGSVWGNLLGLNAYIQTELSRGSRSEDSFVQKVRKRQSELAESVNALIDVVRTALEQQQRRLLLIVEDLDKLMLADATDIFIRHGSLLAAPQADIIYTLPLFTFHSPDAGEMRAHFPDALPFPMLKIADTGGHQAPGFDLIKRIVRKRVAPSVLDEDALHLLVRQTGGVLRDVFQTLYAVSLFTRIRDNRVRLADIKSALRTVRDELCLAIGWPLDEKGERKSPADLYARLAAIARAQSAREVVPPQNDPEIQVLLRSGTLIEYNGERWLGVHPLAREYLRDLKLEPGPDPYLF